MMIHEQEAEEALEKWSSSKYAVFEKISLDFERYPGKVILDVGSGGTWEDDKVYDPSFLRHGGKNYLFYSGYDGTNGRIGYAVADDLFTWRKYGGNPIIDVGGAGAWDEVTAEKPGVIRRHNGETPSDYKFAVFYRGVPSDGGSKIGFAHSTDLTTWTKYSGNPVIDYKDDNQAPSVVYNPSDDKYYLFFYSMDDNNIYYATSPNLEDWTVQGTALTGGAGGEAVLASMSVVQLPRGIWLMSYNMSVEGMPAQYGFRIGLAISEDLENWERLAGNPVLGYERTQSWDESAILGPALALHEGVPIIYYNAKPGDMGSESIGMASAVPFGKWFNPSAHGYFQDDGYREPWNNRTISAGDTTWEVYAGGYTERTIYFLSDSVGTLTIEIKEPDGDWRTYGTADISANTLEEYSPTGEIEFLRISFDADATVTAWFRFRK